MRNTLARVALVFVYAACGLAANNSSFEPSPSAKCNNDVDCSANQVCVATTCASTTQAVSVEVSPGAPALPQYFADVSTTGGINLQLSPPSSFVITSNVFPISVSVTGFSNAIPDIPLSANASLAADGQELRCSPGTYSLLAMPLDGVTPPVSLSLASGMADLTGTNATENLLFATEADGGWVTVHGQIVGGIVPPGNYSSASPVSFNVQALTNDQQVASQSVAATLDGGYAFDLELAPKAATTSVSLVVTPTSGVGTAPTAVFSQSLVSLTSGALLDFGSSVQLATVYGRVTTGGGAPVPNASVTLTGVLTAGPNEGFTSAAVQTDDGGNYSAIVASDPDGGFLYQAVAVPPPDAGLANVVSTVFAVSTSSTVEQDAGTLTVAPMITVTGRVIDNNSLPVPGATVECLADPYLNTGLLPLSQTSQVTTASDGTFQFQLSPGYYDFEYFPPASLNLPSNQRGPLAIGVAGSGADGGTLNGALGDFAFSAARTVTGTLVDALGNPVNNAFVKVFITIPPTVGVPARSVQVSEAQVVSGGTFTAVLPTR